LCETAAQHFLAHLAHHVVDEEDALGPFVIGKLGGEFIQEFGLP
jgi:hypothetical protein